MGNSELALNALDQADALSANSKNPSLRGYILAKSGRRNEAEKVLGTLERTDREGYVPPYALALVYAGLGQRDSAFEWLERAYAARDVHLVFLEPGSQMERPSRGPTLPCTPRTLRLHAHGGQGRQHGAIEADAFRLT